MRGVRPASLNPIFPAPTPFPLVPILPPGWDGSYPGMRLWLSFLMMIRVIKR